MTSLIARIPNVLAGETYLRIAPLCHLNHPAGKIYTFYSHPVVKEILRATPCSAAHIQESRTPSEMRKKLIQEWPIRISRFVVIRVNLCQSVITSITCSATDLLEADWAT